MKRKHYLDMKHSLSMLTEMVYFTKNLLRRRINLLCLNPKVFSNITLASLDKLDKTSKVSFIRRVLIENKSFRQNNNLGGALFEGGADG